MDQPLEEFDHGPKVCCCCPVTSKKVGTKGPWDSPVVIVGEGPGVMEIRKGEPFVGPSGQLIESSWPKDIADGFAYEDCFVANAMQCFVPGSAKDPVRHLKATACCRSRLQDLIGLAPRKVILAFGKWANISLFGKDDFKIMSQRGVLREIAHPGREGETVSVMPILHPAFLLRGQGNLKQFKQDIRRALDIVNPSRQQEHALVPVNAANYVWKDPDYVELPTAVQVRQLIDYIKEIYTATGKKVNVAADIETAGLNWWYDRILCIGLYLRGSGEGEGETDDNIGYVIDWDRILIEWKDNGVDISPITGGWCIRGSEVLMEQRGSLYSAVKELMELQEVNWIWQNGKFDLKFLSKEGINVRVDDDTFLASYAQDERAGGHDLDEMAKNRLGAPTHKEALEEYLPNKKTSYIVIPKSVLWPYLARDVKKTLDVLEYSLIPEIDNDPSQMSQTLYRKCLIPYSGMIARLEKNGFFVDREFVQENDQELRKEIVEAQERVSVAAGEYVNPNSPSQVATLLYDKLGLRLKGKRPKDTTKEVLDKLYESTKHPVLKAIRAYRTLVKVHSTYVKPLAAAKGSIIAPDGRVHSTYNLGRTTTGRLASSDPNLQNIPRLPRIRRMYRSSLDFDHERVIVEGDYNTAELRALAMVSEDSTLTEIFLDGKRSLHDEVATEMYGENFTGDQRIRAKAVNFGIPYGREAFSIAEEFDIVSEEAQRLIDRWFETFPGAAAFIARCRNAPLRGQTLLTPFGRRRRPGVVSAEVLKALQNEFANFFMQSIINDFTLQAALEMEYKLYKLDSFLVNLVHDAALVDAPKTAVKEVRAVMKEHMEGEPKKWVKTPINFLVDFKCGTHWGLLLKEEKWLEMDYGQ